MVKGSKKTVSIFILSIFTLWTGLSKDNLYRLKVTCPDSIRATSHGDMQLMHLSDSNRTLPDTMRLIAGQSAAISTAQRLGLGIGGYSENMISSHIYAPRLPGFLSTNTYATCPSTSAC